MALQRSAQPTLRGSDTWRHYSKEGNRPNYSKCKLQVERIRGRQAIIAHEGVDQCWQE